MRHLCDSNVFLALTVSGHRHHEVARTWFEALDHSDSAEFCRMTQMAFLRLLTTEAVMREHTLSNRRAVAIFQSLLSDARVRFVELEPPGLEAVWLGAAARRQTAPKQWMDCYLAAFSKLSNMSLVTFDRGFRQYEADGVSLLLLGSA